MNELGFQKNINLFCENLELVKILMAKMQFYVVHMGILCFAAILFDFSFVCFTKWSKWKDEGGGRNQQFSNSFYPLPFHIIRSSNFISSLTLDLVQTTFYSSKASVPHCHKT